VRRENRLKRGGGNISDVLDELSEIVSGADDTERVIEEREIIREIDTFLMSLPRDRRDMFILRYWYCFGISDIAARFMKSENSISVSLSRIRMKLRSYLYERGFEV
jgi:RNA polymerase sigma-70 factor (ECF subfamily)